MEILGDGFAIVSAAHPELTRHSWLSAGKEFQLHFRPCPPLMEGAQ